MVLSSVGVKRVGEGEVSFVKKLSIQRAHADFWEEVQGSKGGGSPSGFEDGVSKFWGLEVRVRWPSPAIVSVMIFRLAES